LFVIVMLIALACFPREMLMHCQFSLFSPCLVRRNGSLHCIALSSMLFKAIVVLLALASVGFGQVTNQPQSFTHAVVKSGTTGV
jgi:hypothetical protein